MSERPRFNKQPEDPAGPSYVSAAAFNDLVDFYNELADEYEALYVETFIRNEALQHLDFTTVCVLNNLIIGTESRIRNEGYEAYAKSVLSGERTINKNESPHGVY